MSRYVIYQTGTRVKREGVKETCHNCEHYKIMYLPSRPEYPPKSVTPIMMCENFVYRHAIYLKDATECSSYSYAPSNITEIKRREITPKEYILTVLAVGVIVGVLLWWIVL